MAGQLWEVDALGGFMYSDELSDTLRMEVLPAVKFRQFADCEDGTEKGLNKGDEFYWNVYSKVQNKGGRLKETDVMPETNFEVTKQALIVDEYGNSVPYSGRLNNLSKHPVEKVIRKVLKRDAVETFDEAAWEQFNATGLSVAPTGGNSATSVTLEEGGCTITNNAAMTKEHVKGISDIMKERNIVPYQGDNYYCLAWPTTFRQFKNDLEAIAQHTETGFRHIMNGEIGEYENIVFVEQTNIQKGGAVDSATYDARETPDIWNNGLSDWAFFFGEDTVCEGICIPEEIRGKIPTDYGRSRGVAWYYLGGFGIVHGGTDYLNQRILKWESAA